MSSEYLVFTPGLEQPPVTTTAETLAVPRNNITDNPHSIAEQLTVGIVVFGAAVAVSGIVLLTGRGKR